MKAILPPVAIRWYLHVQAVQSIVWWIDPSICFCKTNQWCPFASLSGEIILYIFFQRYNCQGQCRELTCIWNIFIWPWVQNLGPNVGAHDQEIPHVCWGKDHTKKWWTSPQSIIIILLSGFYQSFSMNLVSEVPLQKESIWILMNGVRESGWQGKVKMD